MSVALRPREFSTSQMTATVYDQGAQVATWAPSGQHEVLWMSQRSRTEVGRSVRGGIPICFPWFGPGRSLDLSPIHGFARVAPWRLVGEDGSADRVRLTYELTQDDASAVVFPHRYHAQERVELGRDLDVSLTVTNTGSAPFEIEEALHAYLVVGDVRQIAIRGLEGASYVDKTAGYAGATQTGALRLTGETDRVYSSGGAIEVADPVLGRTLHIATTGAANVVVWNPWEEKAREISDIAPDGWPGFVCIEGANALADAVTIEPGQRHTMGYRLSVG